MPSVFRSGGRGGGGSVFRRGGSAPAPHAAKKHGGGISILGGLTNAVHTVEASVSGAPSFYKKAYEGMGRDVLNHPWSLAAGPAAPLWAGLAGGKKSHIYKDVVLPFSKDEAYRWGPLFHKHPQLKEWAARNYETGFVPAVLDVLTVVTAGTKGATLATGKSAPRVAKLRLPNGEVIERPVVGSEFSRRARLGVQGGLNKLPPDRALGEHLRAAKYEKRSVKRGALNLEAQLEPYEKATSRLTKNERIAVSLRADWVTKERVLRGIEDLRAIGTDDAIKQAKLFSNTKILDKVANPTKRMLREEAAAPSAYALRKKIMGANLGDETALHRQYRALLLQEGAKYTHLPLLEEPKPLSRVTVNGREGRLLDISRAPLEVGTSRLKSLSKTWDDLVKNRMEQLMPPEERSAEALRRSARNRKLKGQRDRGESGETRLLRPNESLPRREQHSMESEGEWERLPEGSRSALPSRPVLAELRSQAEKDLSDFAYSSDKPEALKLRALLEDLDSMEAAVKGKQISHMSETERAIFAEGEPTADPIEHADVARVQFYATKNGKKMAWEKKVPLSNVRSTETGLVPPAGQTISAMVKKLKAELPFEPRYLPERMVNEGGQTWQGVGGLVEPKIPGALKQNKSILRVTGKIARHFDTLGPNTLRLIKWAAAKETHAKLLKAAVPYENQPIGRGWQFVKRTSSEHMGHIEANDPEFLRALDEMTPEQLDNIVNLEEPGMSGLGDDLVTNDPLQAAVDAEGRRLVIPTPYAKKLIGEYTRNNDMVFRIARSATQVWRALILNLRLPWLENNIIGNSFMYALKLAGVAKHGKMDQQTFLENFGDQSRYGTFFHTQSPTAGIVARALNSRKSPTFWTREWDKAYEGKLRRGATERYLSATPEVKALAKQMKLQRKDWSAAKKKALENDPELAARVSQQVNNALGDFVNLSDAEQKYLRGIVPFYGWFRAVTLVIAKLPLDTPGRALTVATAGRIGQAWTDDWWREHGVDPLKLPWYQRAGIPMGDKWFFKTGGINPYATLAQIMGGDVTDMMNPLIAAPLLGMAKLDYNKANPVAVADAMLRGLVDVGRFMPETQLAFPYNSKSSLGPSGRLGAVERFLGPSIFEPNFGYLGSKK